MHEILPNLWLGSFVDARRHSHAMDAVVNCTVDLPFFGVPKPRMRLPVDDNASENASLAPFLHQAVAFVRAHLAHRRRVLVHCFAGIQRSATVAAAVVMRVRGLSANDAVEFVHARSPNTFLGGANFMASLEAFDQF